MKKIIRLIRSHPARFYLVLFLFLILPATLLFPAARLDSQAGMGFLLALIILANTAALFS